jgi:hypothetical protein
MPLIVPLQALPSQTVSVLLNNQQCQLNIYQKSTGMFMDVAVNNAVIISGVICQYFNRIVRSLYLGFLGDFAFVDTQGSSDPYYASLGTRYILVYFYPNEVPALFTAAT